LIVAAEETPEEVNASSRICGPQPRSAITLLGVSAGVLAGWRGTISLALAESAPNLDGDLSSLQPGQFIWDPERAPKAGRDHRLDPEAAHLRLSQRHTDRRLHLLDRQAGALDAHRRPYHPR
jgi:hypothetical protein